ncbi:MAG: metal-dependent hydrolase [Patescibacteria group bacterium]
MLPPGHVAGAYLVTSAVLILTHPSVSPEQLVILLWIGIFFGIAPDFDFFYGLLKYKTVTAHDDEFDHRKFLSHAPILWLIPSLVIFFLAPTPFWKEIGLLIWVGSWTHFALDSIETGIMWLWPFRKTKMAVLPTQKEYITDERRFFPFWIGLVRWYALTMTSFWLEILTIVIAGVVYALHV